MHLVHSALLDFAHSATRPTQGSQWSTGNRLTNSLDRFETWTDYGPSVQPYLGPVEASRPALVPRNPQQRHRTPNHIMSGTAKGSVGSRFHRRVLKQKVG